MSIYVRAIDQMSNHTAADLRGVAADIFAGAGVVDVDSGYLLVEEAAVPDMSVDVAQGICYVLNSSWTEFASTQRLWDIINDSSVNVAIDSNPSGSTRYDLICMKVDTGVTPDPNASNVATIIAVKGAPGAGIPATPSDHLLLATVEVANGAVSITNSDITDARDQISLRENFAGSWIVANETWTYASATTITVPTDATTKYQKGDKIRISQPTDGVKYFSIVEVSATVLTIAANDDYDLDSEAINNPVYSRSDNPFGFPTWFNYTPSLAASGSMTWTSTTINYAKFRVIGDSMQVQCNITGTTGGSASTTLEATTPLPLLGTDTYVGTGYTADGGLSIACAVFVDDNDEIRLRRYDAANYGLGAGRVMVVDITFPYSLT